MSQVHLFTPSNLANLPIRALLHSPPLELTSTELPLIRRVAFTLPVSSTNPVSRLRTQHKRSPAEWRMPSLPSCQRTVRKSRTLLTWAAVESTEENELP